MPHHAVYAASAICLKYHSLELSHYRRLSVLNVCTEKMTTLKDPDLQSQVERIANPLFYNASGRSLKNLRLKGAGIACTTLCLS